MEAAMEGMSLAVGTASLKALRWKPIYGAEDQQGASAAHQKKKKKKIRQERRSRQGRVTESL